MHRPVDRAMQNERPEKTVVRELWCEKAKEYRDNHPDDDGLLYLTLSGAEGRDIRLLIERGILDVTEVGSLSPKAQQQIVAVENSPLAVSALQSHFPGLKIVRDQFQSLVRGQSAVRYPQGSDQDVCRARVVNLDLNAALTADTNDNGIAFPILSWIVKIAQLHLTRPRRDWSLLLTLPGEIVWNDEVCASVQHFLRDNFDSSPDFRGHAKALLGEQFFEEIASDESCRFSQRSLQEQQKVLMSFVPKKIVQLVHGQQWRVETCMNLHYGDGQGAAPMVTWVIDFIWDSKLANKPNQLYQTCISSVLSSAGHIHPEDGVVVYGQ
jgi:hypothetical protein